METTPIETAFTYPATLKNVASLILQAGLNDQEPNPFNFRLNEFTGRIFRNGSEIEEYDLIDAAIELDKRFSWSGAAPGKQRTRDAIYWAARHRSYHPVREMLNGAADQWDGQERVGSFLSSFCGADYSGDLASLREAQSIALLVACVARVFQPGCKHDLTPVLISPQGWGKSTLIRLMATRGEWYSDTPPNLKDKDALQNLIGVWIYEIAEMRSFQAASQEQVKAFLTSSVDRFRKSYAMEASRHPRQCVFWGTSNDLELRDHTGARRFWPIPLVRRPDLDRVAREMCQVWGEAVHMYRRGVPWFLQSQTDQERALARVLNEEREGYQTEDPWVEPINRFWIQCEREGVEHFQIADLLSFMGIPSGTQSQRHVLRVARLLKSRGFHSRRYRDNGKRMRAWFK